MGRQKTERYRLTVQGRGREKALEALAEAVWRRYRAGR